MFQNQFDINIQISAATVFIQGILSFFSPCVLPLLPIYMGYLSGETSEKNKRSDSVIRWKTGLNTVCFVLGISTAFFILGLGFSTLGLFFRKNQGIFSWIGGIVVIFLGLFQMGVFGFLPFFSTEKRFPLAIEKLRMSPIIAFVMGFFFSFSWTPCVGPALSSVLLMASNAASQTRGFLFIGLYTLGFTLPFLVTGLFTTSVLGFFKKHRGVVQYTEKIGGVLLVLMGVLMITGSASLLSGWLARFS